MIVSPENRRPGSPTFHPLDFQGGLIFYLVRLNRIVLLLSLLSLPIGFDAQWNSIGDSLVLPTFMLGGTYSPGVSAVDVDGDGWEDLTFGNDLHGIDLYLRDSVGLRCIRSSSAPTVVLA